MLRRDAENVLSEEAVTTESFRHAWSRFGTGVTIITTPEPGGGVHGMTANSVVSVSLTPPLALVCIGHNRHTYPLVQKNGRFGISILNSGQEDIARHYTKPPEERGSDEWISFKSLGDSLVIGNALAMMDCRVVTEHVAGDHTLFVAEVESINLEEGEPMMWYRGEFGSFVTG